MQTLIIWNQDSLNRVEWEWIIEKTSVIQALSYLHENKWRIEKIIIKDLPESGIQLTGILDVFIAEPTLIHNIILILADINIDFSDFEKEIKQIEEISSNDVKTWQIENINELKRSEEIIGNKLSEPKMRKPYQKVTRKWVVITIKK